MTPAERRAALVERMRDLIVSGYDCHIGMTELAEDAIDIALEEAAKVAEGPPYRISPATGEVSIRGTDEGNWVVPQPKSEFKGSDYETGRVDAAAAIRALKPS